MSDPQSELFIWRVVTTKATFRQKRHVRNVAFGSKMVSTNFMTKENWSLCVATLSIQSSDHSGKEIQ